MTRTIIFSILLSVLLFISRGQTLTRADLCGKYISIDTNEFKSNYIRKEKLTKTHQHKKIKGKLTIPTADTFFVFKDYWASGSPIDTYQAKYEDTSKSWVWVELESLHFVNYYLINTKTSHIDTLVGPPQKYGDKIVCLESIYTDGPNYVEVYSIEGDRIVLKSKTSQTRCDNMDSIYEVYMKGKMLYVSNGFDKCWKAPVFK